MAFTQYMLEEVERQSAVGRPIISVTSAGSIAFTKNLTQACKLQGKYITLFYDKELGKIGIKFSRYKSEYSMEIKQMFNSAYVPCIRFLKHFKIPKPKVGGTFKQIIPHESIVYEGPMVILNYPNKN